MKAYKLWCEKAIADPDLVAELKHIENDSDAIQDAFYRELEFGTGGLRGVIGAGTNRMNVYTVAKASQGLANYVVKHYSESERKIAISYDSRIKSDLFAVTAARVFAANGIRVCLYKELMPTPCLSFAVRDLGCAAGVMVTASHNPSKYNGYKVYGSDGCQITVAAADEIYAEIAKTDAFEDVKLTDFESAKQAGTITYIPDEVYTRFTEEVKNQSVLFGEVIDKSVSIVYSPLNGSGLKPVLRALSESGYTNITVVKEQELPDGHFPTCPYPNPEIRETMILGMEYAKKENADLLLATDPDCDRVGIAVRNRDNEFVLLSGNETGILLLDYICSQRQKHKKMPNDPVFVKTIVTMDMAKKIADKYGVKTVDVLTGFKFIGEQIALLEAAGHKESYILGFEESYGYLSGNYVRDKDAVNASLLICEMFSYYKAQGISLLEKLEMLYEEFGFTYNTLYSFEFDGESGFHKMQALMDAFRGGFEEMAGITVVKILDYSLGIDGLPKSNVLKFFLKDTGSVVVRPSGTEPKLKIYLSVSAANREATTTTEQALSQFISTYIEKA